MVRERLGYVPALDGLRGVAIAGVVSSHLFRWPMGGGLGVDLFFVLSGFLISTLLLEELAVSGTVSLRRFYARRARRLLPALACLLVVYLVVQAARGVDALGTVARLGLYAGNVYQAFVAPGAPVSGLEHLWSLAEEEQFYLVWPLLLLVLARTRRPAAWIAATVVALVVYRIGLEQHAAHHARLYVGPDTHADGLLLGALLAQLRVRRDIRPPRWLGTVAFLVFTVAVLVRPATAAWDAYGLIGFELAAVVLIAAAVSGTDLASLLAAAPLVWLGRISYSLYLWHFMLWQAFGKHLPLVVLAVSVVCAAASYRFVEQPFRRRRVVRPVPLLAGNA
jgi:peptidoglycan/LPS O-acetylase OafA/YrhL